jgi:biotin-(acetyl-CoA carboxylase) ligase
LDNKSIIEKYKENCFMINKVIKLSTFSGEPISVLVLDIGEKGELVVEYLEGPKKGKKESIISGEILL